MNPYKLFGLIFILLLSIVSVNAALTDTIVSYWKLDKNTGTTATDSVGSNDGTINGATWTTGKINSGLSFDGSTYYASYARNTNIYIYCLNSWSGDELK